MPSRRTLLAAVATGIAGCTSGPGSPSGTASQSPTPRSSPTDETLVSFDATDFESVPADEPVLVVSARWRSWLRTAADGETVRDSVEPEGCGRSPLDGTNGVRLQDAGDRSGTYRLDLETGPHYRYDLEAERADPPESATVHDLSELSAPVAAGFETLLEEGAATFEAQSATYQFASANSRESQEYQILLFVRRDGTTYRVHARIPTYTPACDYYVVLGLSPQRDASPEGTLSLAGPDGTDAIARRSDHDAVVQLAELPAAARGLVERFDYVMTVADVFRLHVQK